MQLDKLQDRIEGFMQENDLDAAPGFRVLDLVSEVGEIAKDATKSSDYRLSEEMNVKEDEIGDALFSLLAVANRFDIEAEEAMESALEKYEKRINQKGDPGSR